MRIILRPPTILTVSFFSASRYSTCPACRTSRPHTDTPPGVLSSTGSCDSAAGEMPAAAAAAAAAAAPPEGAPPKEAKGSEEAAAEVLAAGGGAPAQFRRVGWEGGEGVWVTARHAGRDERGGGGGGGGALFFLGWGGGFGGFWGLGYGATRG